MRKLLGLLILLVLPMVLRAQCTGSSPTWTSTPDEASLQTCVTNASAGDTINVTAGSGSVTWSTTGINATKNLSIIGPGTANLTINDAIPTNASACSAFNFRPTVVGSLTRISGFTIQPASGVTSVCPAVNVLGACNSNGCTNMRMDHITFNGWANVTRYHNSYGINAFGDVFGVVDHNTINGVPGAYLQLIELNNATYQGIGQYGDNSWNQPEHYGSSNFLFIENNTFSSAGCCETETTAFGYTYLGGARVVVRFNTFTVSDSINSSVAWHGTETGGRTRSPRAFEAYGNTYTCASGGTCGDVIGIRGGTGYVWGNSVNKSGASVNNFFSFRTYRTNASLGGWGACDGSSVYDKNDGVTYYSGTVASYNSDTHTITVSGSPSWTTNQWIPTGAPYSIHDATKSTGAEITSNGSNTVSIGVGSGGPGDWSPSAGDSILILRATACIDQAGGRGAGILYGGSPATPLASSAEIPSPAYFVANPFSGGSPVFGYVGTSTGRIIRNRDYYTDNLNQSAQINSITPFDGTTAVGMGYGVLADRPSTCTPGVGYLATDQGSWNSSSPLVSVPGTKAPQGQLFICGVSGWPATASYTPYTYPHPLISGGTSSGNLPNPPTALLATVQ